jgi:uncharacterized coiled-coil DUF342 family protein
MKPINAPERRKSFITFLLFYLLTTALIVTAVFFGMRVPFKQNQRLNDQIAVYDKERAFSETFNTRASEIKSLLDSVNRAGVQAELVDGKISENLSRLNNMIDNEGTSIKKPYQDIVQNYADLQAAKKQLRDASGKDANLSQYLQQIEMLKSDLNQSRSEANALRLQIMSMQR